MKRLPSIAVSLVLVALVAGCAESGVSEQELQTAEHDAFAQGRHAGFADGLRASRRASHARVEASRDAAFQRGFDSGVDYVLRDHDVTPGQDYAIAFRQGRRGFFVKDWLPMKPGQSYECPPQSPVCTVTVDGTEVPAATAEPAPADPCDPSYPNVCLDADAPDYDCAGSGEDGPEFVEGPVRILGSDPFDLDGNPRDGIGCVG
jgi:hypothetical protein